VVSLSPLDWGIVAAYLLLALLAGVALSRLAGRDIESYFIAGRQLPWWWLGTSMVATSFAADTPLVVTGLVANHGVAGNWFWWSWVLSYVSMAVVFAALWRRSGVLTDAELVELRYAGRSAAVLRGFKAVFFAVLINGIVLGWVIRAMTKIAGPFVHWEAWLGPERYATLAGAWPSWLLFGTMGDTLTVLVLFGLVTLYSTLGGIRGVIFTDLIQFTIAIVASVVFAVAGLRAVGGVDGLKAGLAEHYGSAEQVLSFTPGTDAAWLPVQVFLIYLAVQWWAQYFSDGTGYLAQRLFTARTDADAEAGGLWFCVANFVLRTWPWVIIAVVALVVFPLGAEGTGEAARMVAEDREMAYPVLMGQLLPAGLLGLLFASLLAAFMSTVDTHINWGSSYLVNDLYRRFLRPGASQRELVRVSRAAVVLLAVLAILIASQIGSIEQAWRFFVAIGAGLGLPAMVRWLWWRANAWTEIAGMVVAVIAAVGLYALFPDVRDEYLLVVIVALATSASLIATFVTAPVPREHLRTFVERVRPPGHWPGFAARAPAGTGRRVVMAWVAANVAVFGLTFGVGHLVFARHGVGVAMSGAGLAALLLTIHLLRRTRAAV
jgi:solute:Na+ symporter, SSS family